MNPQADELLKRIQLLIERDKLVEAIHLAKTAVKTEEKDYYTTLSGIEGKLSNLERDMTKDVINRDAYNTGRSTIRASVSSCVNDILQSPDVEVQLPAKKEPTIIKVEGPEYEGNKPKRNNTWLYIRNSLPPFLLGLIISAMLSPLIHNIFCQFMNIRQTLIFRIETNGQALNACLVEAALPNGENYSSNTDAMGVISIPVKTNQYRYGKNICPSCRDERIELKIYQKNGRSGQPINIPLNWTNTSIDTIYIDTDL